MRRTAIETLVTEYLLCARHPTRTSKNGNKITYSFHTYCVLGTMPSREKPYIQLHIMCKLFVKDFID